MNLFKKQKTLTAEEKAQIEIKNFFDIIVPGAIKFNVNHFVCGNQYRSVWAISGYPYSTKDNAILESLAALQNVTLHIYCKHLPLQEQDRVIENAERKNSYNANHGKSAQVATATSNIKDIADLLLQLSRSKEPLVEATVMIELRAKSIEELTALQSDVRRYLKIQKVEIDELLLLQEEGFKTIAPGTSLAKRHKYSRIIPASSLANLYPFNYAGKNDPMGFFVGKDKYGSSIILDLNVRSRDKTNSHCLVLGNSGEGKSYLAKLLSVNLRELGKKIVIIDPDGEFEDITLNLGGCYLDYGANAIVINPLEIRSWDQEDDGSPLSQHISFLRDFFSAYKNYTSEQLDAIEICITELYKIFNITDDNFSATKTYPQLSDLYHLIEKKFNQRSSGATEDKLFTEELLRTLLLSLKTICVGSASHYFNGVTEIPDSTVLAFGFKQLLDTNENLLNALLFNTFSYMHHQMIYNGNVVGIIDELHLFLKYKVALNYIRTDLKRVRKYDSSFILSSQNIADFLLPDIKEYTKPLFEIPTYSFLFYPGNVDKAEYIDAVGITPEEYQSIASPCRGSCLMRSGSERHLLQVQAPSHKAALFGNKGGR